MNKECLRCKTRMKEVEQANAPSLVIENNENKNEELILATNEGNVFYYSTLLEHWIDNKAVA